MKKPGVRLGRQYKSVNVMGSLIGIDRLEIRVAHRRVLIRNTVAAVHVTGHSGNVQLPQLLRFISEMFSMAAHPHNPPMRASL